MNRLNNNPNINKLGNFYRLCSFQALILFDFPVELVLLEETADLVLHLVPVLSPPFALVPLRPPRNLCAFGGHCESRRWGTGELLECVACSIKLKLIMVPCPIIIIFMKILICIIVMEHH